MFHATLEEMEQLKVVIEELPSTVIYELFQNTDYDKRIQPFTIPECIVSMDKARLQQVIDNIISNSYKYAGTEIAVAAQFEDRFLAVEIRDTGPGAPPDDLPLIFEKFHRGANAEGKSGTGLGLFIARHLMTKMGGDIKCAQDERGFAMKILLAM
jgi:signal transduction histidine kinase